MSAIKIVLANALLYVTLLLYSPALGLVAIVYRLIWGKLSTRFPNFDLPRKEDFMERALVTTEPGVHETCIKCGDESTSIIDFDCPHFLCQPCAEKYFDSPWQPTKCLYCSRELFRLTSLPTLYLIRAATSLLVTLVLIQAVNFCLDVKRPRKTTWPPRAFYANVAMQIWSKTEGWDWDRVLAKWEREYQGVVRKMLVVGFAGLSVMLVSEIVLLESSMPNGIVA